VRDLECGSRSELRGQTRPLYILYLHLFSWESIYSSSLQSISLAPNTGDAGKSGTYESPTFSRHDIIQAVEKQAWHG
jgi:hypothetical protein